MRYCNCGTSRDTIWYTVVGVAQLVEPRVVIPVVVGSSPIVHPILLEGSALSRACQDDRDRFNVIPAGYK
jgi:hypothetical protein